MIIRIIMKRIIMEKKITAYTEEELRYGKYLLDNKSEVLYEYLNKELMSCNNIRDNLLNKEQSVSVKNRIKAIDEDIAVINKALGKMEGAINAFITDGSRSRKRLQI